MISCYHSLDSRYYAILIHYLWWVSSSNLTRLKSTGYDFSLGLQESNIYSAEWSLMCTVKESSTRIKPPSSATRFSTVIQLRSVRGLNYENSTFTINFSILIEIFVQQFHSSSQFLLGRNENYFLTMKIISEILQFSAADFQYRILISFF